MKRMKAAALALGVVGLLSVSGGIPAGAASGQLRNSNGSTLYCGTGFHNVLMTNFYTDRTDISVANYRDQYLSGGVWVYASAQYTLSDSDTNDYTMVTSLNNSSVRVRANHFVTTQQQC